MSDWQPMETAPKDGTVVLLLEPPELTGRVGYGHVTVACWSRHKSYVAGGHWTDGTWVVSPTHWMPLPEPPK